MADKAAKSWLAEVAETPAVRSFARRLEKGSSSALHGIPAAAQPFFSVLLQRLMPEYSVVVITENLKTQESFQQDVETWTAIASLERQVQTPTAETSPASRGNSRVLFYPPWETLPHEPRLPHADIISDRLETLVALVHPSGRSDLPPPIVVTSVAALLQKTFSPTEIAKRTRSLQRGDRLDPLDLIEWLEEQGYEPEAQVTQKGEIAVRGGIVDVFPPTSPWPARLEFFGDELESLRQFDPQTQVSREETGSLTLPPAGELGILKKFLGANTGSPASSAARESTGPASSSILPLATILDYLPSKTVVLLCEPEKLAERADEYARHIPDGDPFYISWENFNRQIAASSFISLAMFETAVTTGSASDWKPGNVPASPTSPPETEMLSFASLDAYRPLGERAPDPLVAEAQRREFFDQLHRWLRRDYAIRVFCNNSGEQQRFAEIWNDLHGGTKAASAASPIDGRLHTSIGALSRGFLYEDAKLVVVTDAEIFGRYKVQRPRRLKSPHAQAARSALDIDFTELSEGDLVVHVQHGIGRYLGLKTLPSLGRKPSETNAPEKNAPGQECLVIEYAPSDPAMESPKLYVPVTEAHLVGKYVGAGKARPPLNTLGGMRWAKAKEHAERAVRAVAGDLLSIQAARESQPGHAFGPDVAWQHEFEGSFVFEETPDQLRAIREAKADMERPKPMDRLICGDVGFGKTEVAIRAAFKAVMGGRQVALLVPTTVLAQQHFNTFRERMADYPVRIDLLSRFRTRRQQERVVEDLAAGTTDIVIGTHRLLQEDVVFKDLGLVVIDEEQRFGVLHKEKFKQLRRMVDVLTLSATPIPRTLYLALTGARDMSTIQTPPHDRLPVETIVAQYDERLIRDAIQRELDRGGQVFFLHNRVMTIPLVEQKLRALLPHVRLVVGHGQMHSDDLEEVMTRFVNGEADVLLSTTIIESGLDIPNANTIIIDRADRFGLSDLYQLRGRVGRYKHQAYAYLLLPRHAGLLTDARRRISAIKQYATLGSGFKIAMRDLEIRGAGNLLGAEQSGHITAVGFELYCQLLKQSVAALKGEKVQPRVEVGVRLDFLAENAGRGSANGRELEKAPVAAALPHSYVPEPQHRIEIYRKLAQAADKTFLNALQAELRDRFGPPPPGVELLLQLAELKILAAERKVTLIEVKEDKLMLTRQGDFITIGGKFPRLTKKQAPARLKEIKKLLLAL